MYCIDNIVLVVIHIKQNSARHFLARVKAHRKTVLRHYCRTTKQIIGRGIAELESNNLANKELFYTRVAKISIRIKSHCPIVRIFNQT